MYIGRDPCTQLWGTYAHIKIEKVLFTIHIIERKVRPNPKSRCQLGEPTPAGS